ncbi:CHASE3 domain-containing protein [uncultured Dokdonia sp.]|uniref:CHASE3 domain-containing protein n=1 Tax=uncultured Dokdonia sp. TaxID=575653 RepID=UPI002630A77B|nr:CHASE3 domain-containing protein [uncultured Dokdonia sp.]
MTIIRKIYKSSWFVKVVFVVSLFAIIFIAGLGYKHISNLSKSTDLVIHTYKVNVELEQILSYLKDAETGQRGFIITQDSSYLEPYLKGRNKVNNSIAELKFLMSDNPEQQDNLKELSILIDKRLDNLEIAANYAAKEQTNLTQFKDAFQEGKNYMEAITNKLHYMIAHENDLLEKRNNEYINTAKITPVFLYIFILLTLVLMYGAYAKINSNVDKLKKSNQELEVFIEATKQSEIINKHGSWRWNVEENTFYFSDNLFRLLGEEPNSFDQTIENFLKFVHPEDVDKLSAQVEKMKEEKNLPFIIYRVVHKDGTIHHLKAYGKSIVNSEGLTQLLGTTTDISDEIDHYDTLEKRNQELELNNKELQAFNYVASHDLQEPLRKIQTFLSRLEDKEQDNLSESGKKYVERIHIASGRMRLLIDDLLQYSRTNKSDEVLKKSNINKLFEDAQQDLAEVIISKNATITVDAIPDMKVIPFQIQQLFGNLIGNSLKYSVKDRDPVITITYDQVSSKDDERLLRGSFEEYHKIVISDNGIGFEQSYADKIFTLFSRLHNKDEYSGTGIGLSICRKITDNHSGFIFAKGEPNKGATFMIYLPVT